MQIEFDDIQSIILRGYSNLPFARFLVLKFADVAKVRVWLGELIPLVIPFDGRAKGVCQRALHVAFSPSGLRSFGLSESILSSFSRPFREGMTTTQRRRALGDHGVNDPDQWLWRGDESGCDLLLMCYAETEDLLEELLTELKLYPSIDASTGIEQLISLETNRLAGAKEHFGFRDGISQPKIVELASRKRRLSGEVDQVETAPDEVKLGEFVLGYANEYGEYSHSPSIAKGELDGKQSVNQQTGFSSLLSSHQERRDHYDLGKNGTYLVFRQIEQNVPGFWRYVSSQSHLVKHPDKQASQELTTHWLAAKMVGRWADGAPLTLAPHYPPPSDDPMNRANGFGFHEQDQFGYGCPFGSHIRRCNPRDSLEPQPGTEDSWSINRTHRIMRRGRTYGPPLVEDFDIEKMTTAEDDQRSRGLHFICFNSDIARQFEFLQQSWINNKKFTGLHNDADPLIGDHDPRGEGVTGQFTIQAQPVRQRVKELGVPEVNQFAKVVGGGYFFMPGIKVLKALVDVEWSSSS